MSRNSIRLGLVGGGDSSFIGGVHRAAAALCGRYTIAAACLSSDPARARQFAARIGIAPDRGYDSFTQMAASERARPDGIEAVAILTPNGLHYEVAKTFIRAGVHIICEKPLTTRLADARHLIELARGSDRVIAVAHAYTGYSTVHEARARIKGGALGAIRIIQVEYAQSWLATALERSGHAIAQRRTDPELNGAAGCVAAIGSHAFNLASFVSGLSVREVSAELTAFVPGRAVPDNAHIMLRYAGDARGMMWISQVAPGHENDLRLRVYGDKASLFWSQRDPDNLIFSVQGEPSQRLVRGGPASLAEGPNPMRAPSGHPEGFVEAFANLYRDVARQIAAVAEHRACDPAALWVPNLRDGAQAVAFADAVLESSKRNGGWTQLSPIE
jgi:predicted dehydrogenase